MNKTIIEKLKDAPVIGIFLKTIGQWRRDTRNKIVNHIFYLRNKHILAKTSALKNEQKGKRIFIFGSGPSIATQDLKPLRDEVCISISNFFLHKDFDMIKPEYHLIPASHHPITDEQFVALFKDTEEHLPDGQKILLSITDKYMVDKFQLFTKQKVYYYFVDNYKKINGASKIDMTSTLPEIMTAAHTAMYLAIYLGAKEVNLLGYDHNGLRDAGIYLHFYKEEETALWKSGYRPGPTTDIEPYFGIFIKLWRVYKGLRQYAQNNGIIIQNATPGSYIDVYPRKNLEDILKQNDERQEN